LKYTHTCYYTVKDQGVYILTELGQLPLERMHSKSLSHATQEQSGLRSWYSLLGFIHYVRLFYVSLNSFTSERLLESLTSSRLQPILFQPANSFSIVNLSNSLT